MDIRDVPCNPKSTTHSDSGHSIVQVGDEI